ncbi:SidA/IucD/PvdA family monooxygenase [Azospirillum soli]|uniref:SidA/IucD/PvdA family monooxygenase n=1 Tax=Azospirillum soli TaxID=1304799 RepID=UPI001AE516E3|nr:SidA/IucD/PvdA family monooxygenase [Azospirillum soli]MBP2314298.1 L-ornithine N5-oxygenase [Azospirillum soli]
MSQNYTSLHADDRASGAEVVRVDCLGVGFGPGNIALAISLEEGGYGGDLLFLERAVAPDWHPEMLLEGADIQHNPLRDFVTPRNPSSPYGFLSFLKSEGRLFDFLNLDAPYPPRTEYARYIRWVARQFDRHVSYAESVERLTLAEDDDGTPLVLARTSLGRRIAARGLSLAPGRSPLIPTVFAPHIGDRVVHFTNYLTSITRWAHEGRLGSVALIGASQSAVEIVLDLAARFPQTRIHNVQRGFGYKLKDTSPFTEHIYFPEFVDYYYAASDESKAEMTRELWRSNYGSADHDVISQLYAKLYEQKLTGRNQITLYGYQSIDAVEVMADGPVRLSMNDRHAGTARQLEVDAVIVATGFRNFGAGPEQELWHPMLADIAPHARKRPDGTLYVTRDFQLEPADPARPIPPIMLNGVCESTHGFGDAGSFSLLSVRTWRIAQALRAALDAPVRKPEPAE